jgi:hypothetical protein
VKYKILILLSLILTVGLYYSNKKNSISIYQYSKSIFKTQDSKQLLPNTNNLNTSLKIAQKNLKKEFTNNVSTEIKDRNVKTYFQMKKILTLSERELEQYLKESPQDTKEKAKIKIKDALIAKLTEKPKT